MGKITGKFNTHNFVKLLFASLLVVTLYANSEDSLLTKRTFTESEITNYVEKFKSEVAEELHVPCMGMAIVYNDTNIYIDGEGFENISTQKAIDPRMSRFGIASTSKIFTHLAVMQLADKGLINLNDNIFDYLDFKNELKYDEPIRIIDLMNHQPGFEESSYKLKAKSFETLTPMRDWLIETAPKQVYKPGTYTAYSNYGITLLGQLVESVSGKSYEDYVQENIFDVLGMKNSTCIQKVTENTVLLYNYSQSADSFVHYDYEYWNNRPAACIQSTPEDMAIFCAAMMNGGAYKGKRILSEKYMNIMQETSYTPDENINGIAHGLMESEYNGYKSLGHPGDNSYQHTLFNWYNELGIGFYITGDGAESSTANSKFMTEFIDSFYVKKSKTYEFIDNIDLSNYTGYYFWARSNYSSFQKLFQNGTNLTITPDGNLSVKSALTLKPVNKNFFVSEDGNTKVYFKLDNNGKATGFNYYTTTAHIKHSPLEAQTTQIIFLLVGLLFLIVIAIARIIGLIKAKIKKNDNKQESRIKRLSNIFIAYVLITIPLTIAFVNIKSIMLGNIGLIRLAGILFIVYVPITITQLIMTVRLFIKTSGYRGLKTVELLISLAFIFITAFMLFWNLAGIVPYN